MKKRISILMVLTILIINICVLPVHASVLTNSLKDAKEAQQAMLDLFDNANHIDSTALNNFFKAAGTLCGFIAAYTQFSQSNFTGIFNSKNYGGLTIPQDSTEQETMDAIGEYLCDNVVITDNDISFNNGTDKILKDYLNSIIANSGYKYVYSYDINEHLELFNDGNLYNATRRFLIQYQNDNLIIGAWNAAQDFILIPKDAYTITSVKENWENQPATVYLYDFVSWQMITGSFDAYTYDNVSHNFVKRPNMDKGQDATRVCVASDSLGLSMPFYPQFYLVTVGTTYTLKSYATLADLKSDSTGIAPYYVTQYYGDFINNTGDYKVNSDNYNPITYGDITAYIDSYNTQNGVNPSPDQIQIHIDNNITSGGGGSSSSGQGATATATATNGDVTVNNNINIGWPTSSGNSISQNDIDEGTSSIFGFISSIGKYLADLIKNLGSALAELIGALTSIITDITENIPNLFSGIIEIVFSGLPDEIRAVILLGITLMVTYGIFKMIRG